MKGYQQEIDTLTSRARSAETSFLSLYKELHEAPDPVVALETAQNLIKSSMDSNATAARSVAELNRTIAALEEEIRLNEREFSQLKNQDITIVALRDKVASFEQEMENRYAINLTRILAGGGLAFAHPKLVACANMLHGT